MLSTSPQDPSRLGLVAASGGPASQTWEVACRRAHTAHCDEVLRAASAAQLMELVREHGARRHGYTRAWYTLPRTAQIAAGFAVSSGRVR